jgi:integrase
MARIRPAAKAGVFYVQASIGSGAERVLENTTINATTRTIKRLAAEWESDVRAAHAKAATPVTTLADVWAEFIAANPRWGHTHRANHERARRDTADGLGAMSIDAVRRIDIAEHLSEYAATPVPGNKDRSSASIQMRLKYLRSVFQYALDEELIERDPTRRVEPPEGRFIEEAQVAPLAEMNARIQRAAATLTDGAPMAGLCTVAVCTGMRRGELLGLQHGDITFTADGSVSIRVRRSVVKYGAGRRGSYVKKTKTGHRRTVVAPAAAAAVFLEAQMAREVTAIADDVAADMAPPETAFVFSEDWGHHPIEPLKVEAWWRAMQRTDHQLGTFKDIRTALSSELNALGLHRAAVAAHLGHSEAVNAEHYDHVRPDDSAAILDAVTRRLSDG